MKFGIFDHVDDNGRPLEVQLEERLQLVEAYDRVGFYAYHIAEHHATPLGRAPSPSVLLAAISQRTRRLRFGPLVYLLSIYHPLRLIEEICMLDALSGGRLELGVGPGASLIEMGFFGLEEDDRRSKFEEALEIVRLGLTNERLTYHGRFWQFDDVPLPLSPVQQPHPPLWYGAGSPDSIAWCAREGINMVTLAFGERVSQVADLYRSEWASHGGSEEFMPLVGASRHIVVAESDEAAQTIARPAYQRWRESFMHLWIERGFPRPLAEIYPDSWDELQARGNCCAGSPATVRAFVETEASRGITYLLSWFAFGGMTVGEVTHSVELFAGEVMPRFG